MLRCYPLIHQILKITIVQMMAIPTSTRKYLFRSLLHPYILLIRKIKLSKLYLTDPIFWREMNHHQFSIRSQIHSLNFLEIHKQIHSNKLMSKRSLTQKQRVQEANLKRQKSTRKKSKLIIKIIKSSFSY
jgi:hypothetical protein